MKAFSERKYVLPALVATLAFFLLTCWTKYPFLVEDYYVLWKARLPTFGLRDFDFLFAQRPLASIVNYLTFRSGILEYAKAPVLLLFYFIHSVGVLLIFYRLVEYFLPKEKAKSDLAMMAVGAVICLYPDWYEITLLGIDLPYGLGVIFLGLAIWQEKLALRSLLYLLSFCCLETYLFPALALAALEVRKRGVRVFLPIFVAGVCYLLLERTLLHILGIHPHYDIVFGLQNSLQMARMYLGFLFSHSFYKANWVSTALDLLAMALAAGLIVRADRSWLKRLGLLILLPIVGAAHSLVLIYYAPRAVHGAMVLKTAASGVVLLACLRLKRESPVLRWAPLAGVLLAFVIHHGLIASNRSYNQRILAAKEAEVENTLRTCTSPCRISLNGIEDQFRWDWIMRPSFHAPFVLWIKERMNVQKEVTAD